MGYPRCMPPSITLVGQGRLGRSLGLLLERAGWSVQRVGREPLPAGAGPVLLTVNDDAIPTVAARVPPHRLVLHASGASSLEVLGPHAATGGSFHPLMTFPGPDIGLPDLQGVPAALAGSPDAVALGRDLANALGMWALEVPGDRRLYHAAAVMAGNFATVLLADAARVLEAAGVPRARAGEALVPLALASLRNAGPDPVRALTGPVARGDDATIAAHLDALRASGLHDAHDVYAALTQRARGLLAGDDDSD